MDKIMGISYTNMIEKVYNVIWLAAYFNILQKSSRWFVHKNEGELRSKYQI